MANNKIVLQEGSSRRDITQSELAQLQSEINIHPNGRSIVLMREESEKLGFNVYRILIKLNG